MTDIEQREPVAAYTVDLTGCEHLSRDVANIERIAASGSEGPTAVHHLYTGQQLAEVEARVTELEEVIKMMANAPPVIPMPTILKGADTAEQRVEEMVRSRDLALNTLRVKSEEAERLRALVEEAKPQCCMCGKKGLSTVEGDGGTECELSDGRWVCSAECWDRATECKAPVSADEVKSVLEPFASVEVNELYDDGDEVSWPFFYAHQLRAARDLRDRLGVGG